MRLHAGEWAWDVTVGKCLTSVQMLIASAPVTAGNCTQVAYAMDNPGYDENVPRSAAEKGHRAGRVRLLTAQRRVTA
jgi:hypothetical protein